MAGVLLLSGGMDSIAIAHWKRSEIALAVTVDYGQLCAQAEESAAKAVCEALSLPHEVLRIDCRSLGSGSLAGQEALPGAPTPEWWPFRNQLLISLAAMTAVRWRHSGVLIGTVAGDDRHADGKEEFLRLMDQVVSFQEGGIRVLAPAIAMSSPELIRRSQTPRTLLAWSHSCHRANEPCGDCRGCNKHANVLEELGW